MLDYTINQIGKENKLAAINQFATEVLQLDKFAVAAVSLINPLSQYEFLENTIIQTDGIDDKIIEYLKKYSYPLPRRWGWKQTRIVDGNEELMDHVEWYEKEHDCYCDMFKSAMYEIRNAVDCCDDISIKRTKNTITIDAIGVKEIFENYEME